jgi:uncharacterized membrane protein
MQNLFPETMDASKNRWNTYPNGPIEEGMLITLSDISVVTVCAKWFTKRWGLTYTVLRISLFDLLFYYPKM